jgi:hypothetical protein
MRSWNLLLFDFSAWLIIYFGTTRFVDDKVDAILLAMVAMSLWMNILSKLEADVRSK